MIKVFGKSIICLFIMAIPVLWPIDQSRAFHTGHHFDLSRLVLKREGFSPDAINSACLASWLTDYYSNAPSNNLLLKTALNRLHFDNLRSRKEILNYYHQFMSNLQTLSQEAADRNDVPAMLVVIGVAQHVIQDLYAHSNWVELYKRLPTGAFDIRLFPQKLTSLKGKLRSGAWPGDGKYGHGGYNSGMNKDSHLRPGWENAFVTSHVATIEITRQIQRWVEVRKPGFWGKIKQFSLSKKERKELHQDIRSAKNISMWVRANVLGLPSSDGHWKGNHSGHSGKFSTANNAFTVRENSIIARQFRQSDITTRLALNLKKPPKIKRPITLNGDHDNEYEGRAIIVKIQSYELALKNANASAVGARITVNGEPYEGRIFSRKTGYHSDTIPAWHEIHIEPYEEGPIQVSLELFTQRNNKSATEIPVDINPQPEHTALTISLEETDNLVEKIKEKLTGLSTGILVAEGDAGNSARITYFVEVHDIN